MITDILFFSGTARVIRNRVQTGNSANTFSYLFNYRGAASFIDIFLGNPGGKENFGVGHVDDLFYIFPFINLIKDFRVMTEEDHQIRKQMVKMWTNFAKYGWGWEWFRKRGFKEYFFQLFYRNPSTEELEWTPTKKVPIDYMRIGNCNFEACDPERKTMSAMDTGFYEKRGKLSGEFGLWTKVAERAG